jgi:acyl-coenzyme A thioesterase PaaI-like protein
MLPQTEYLSHDVVASHVLNSSFDIGEKIDLTIEFTSPGGSWMFQCNGEIVRVEDRNGKVGMSLRVVDSVMGSA